MGLYLLAHVSVCKMKFYVEHKINETLFIQVVSDPSLTTSGVYWSFFFYKYEILLKRPSTFGVY